MSERAAEGDGSPSTDLVLLPADPTARVYRAERRVRLGDADPAGRLRLDAAARYLHDVSNDDSGDSGLVDDGSWVVRRTELDVLVPARMMERVALATWCGGTGARWAERRVSIEGHRGGRIEANALWVYVDLATMLPKRLDPSFLQLYGTAAAGRTITSRLVLDPTPSAAADRRPWPLRRTDLDVLGHVNNAAYWAAVEEVLAERPALAAGPHRATLEFAKPIEPGDHVEMAWAWTDGALSLWLQVGGTTHATAVIAPR